MYRSDQIRVLENDTERPEQAVDISYKVPEKDPKNILAQYHLKSGPSGQVSAGGHDPIIIRRRWNWLSHVLTCRKDSIIKTALFLTYTKGETELRKGRPKSLGGGQ